jgi:hypothetical protein
MLRVVDGGSVFGLVLLAALAVDFLCDWTFRFNLPQRGFLLALFVVLILWGMRRFVWPALASDETVIDLALAVERRQGIDSDLVAALQFDSAGARAWGSSQLQAAVIGSISRLGKRLSLEMGLSDQRPGRKAIPLVVAAGIVACAGAVFPDYMAAFVDRLLLGSAHYPTRTTITRITVNDQQVFPNGLPGGVTNIPFGPAVRFVVESSGAAPESGEVRVSARSGAATSIYLLPGIAKGQGPLFYTGELARLTENVSYQVFLGDAWTEPGTIRVIPAPVVSLELDHTPPAYAATARLSRLGVGSRQIAVLEGSQVSLAVNCANKPLEKVELMISSRSWTLTPQDDDMRRWKLAGHSPLARIAAAISFDVEVVDVDGMSPDQPLRGQIYIEADRPPRIAAAVVSERVLPAARPAVSWGAADDYGIAEVRLLMQVTRSGGQVEQFDESVRRIPAAEQPQTVLRGRHVLDLTSLGLAKGDEVRVTLQAIDYRGDQPGASATSDSILLTVTDESGILAGLIEADEKSARQLDQIIQRQLGIGEGR